MNDEFDALIEVTLLSTSEGGGKTSICSGYKGQHLIKENYQTSGNIQLIDKNILNPGETATAFVNYLSPDFYPKTLWIGKEMELKEGGRIVGRTIVKEIYNKILLKENI